MTKLPDLMVGDVVISNYLGKEHASRVLWVRGKWFGYLPLSGRAEKRVEHRFKVDELREGLASITRAGVVIWERKR